jgi:two-component system OmpR family sensor kinase
VPAGRRPRLHRRRLDRGRRWGALRHWRRWTLRSRLVLAIAALAAVGLIVSGAVGVAALRSYLLGQVDNQLVTAGRFADLRTAPFAADPARSGERPNFGPDNGTYRFDANGVLTRKDSDASPDLGTPAEI